MLRIKNNKIMKIDLSVKIIYKKILSRHQWLLFNPHALLQALIDDKRS